MNRNFLPERLDQSKTGDFARRQQCPEMISNRMILNQLVPENENSLIIQKTNKAIHGQIGKISIRHPYES